jgi:hypothetical protein
MPFPTSIITEEEQKKYSLIFKRENPENTGQISGQKAFVMFTRSGLPQTDLAMIWSVIAQYVPRTAANSLGIAFSF